MFSVCYLQRVNYLKSKKFSSGNVASMVSRAPYLLNFSVKRLDNRLGFYQQQLNISASNVSICVLSQCAVIHTQKEMVNFLIGIITVCLSRPGTL